MVVVPVKSLLGNPRLYLKSVYLHLVACRSDLRAQSKRLRLLLPEADKLLCQNSSCLEYGGVTGTQ